MATRYTVTKQKVWWVEQWLYTWVVNLFTSPCRPLQNNNIKWTSSIYFRKWRATTANFSQSLLKLNGDIKYYFLLFFLIFIFNETSSSSLLKFRFIFTWNVLREDSFRNRAKRILGNGLFPRRQTTRQEPNGPYLYFRHRTGNSLQLRLMQGVFSNSNDNLFLIFPPHGSPLQASSS